MSRADVQQFSRPRGFETLGDWQGTSSEVSEPIEVLVRLPDVTAPPTPCPEAGAHAAPAASACAPKGSKDKPAPAPAAASRWIPAGSPTQWADKLRLWGQKAQATAAAAVVLLIVIALFLIRGRDGGESHEAAARLPQDVESRLVELPAPAGDRSLGIRDLPVVPLLPQSSVPFEASPHLRQTGQGGDLPRAASANDLAPAASDGKADDGAGGGSSSATSSQDESAPDDSSDEQPTQVSAEDAEHRHSATADAAAGPSQTTDPSTAPSDSPEDASEREVSGVPVAERSAEDKRGETSGEAAADEADKQPPVEASELVQAITRPPGPSVEIQFTQQPGAVDRPSSGAEFPVVRRSYPVTNPASYQYPSDYHRLFFSSAPDPAGATGVPSRETRSIYETPSNTARLQPQIEPPPMR